MRLRLACLLVSFALGGCGFQGFSESRSDAGSSPPPSPTEAETQTEAPAPKDELRFAVIGDMGMGNTAQRQVAERMCHWRGTKPFDLVITTGDNVYNHGAPEDFAEKFFEPYSCLLDDGVRFRAALGNHDVETDGGRPQLDEPAFGMKARHYVVRKQGVRFVIADSNSVNRAWLDRATKAETGDRWTIVVMHHPIYSGGTGHGSTMELEDLSKLFARRGVDLVLHGHDHVYSVSRRMRGGVRYVVTGGGGADLYGCTPRDYIRRCEASHHFLYVRATEEQITARAVPISGPPFHRFRVQ